MYFRTSVLKGQQRVVFSDFSQIKVNNEHVTTGKKKEISKEQENKYSLYLCLLRHCFINIFRLNSLI